ncbi:hypothetical protein [Chryseobacterium sp. OSA05B]|uniref:hypothetical protein n=1 Tax=Chryseobacterium sp. OSA05B TaxID=2862650 RepID=UPI001CC16B8D|nr:hypothetical protein [Chryseobacterium sp. OSA05B]
MDEKILKLSIALFLFGLFSILVNYITSAGDEKVSKGEFSKFFNHLVKTKSKNFTILSYFLFLLSIIIYITKNIYPKI